MVEKPKLCLIDGTAIAYRAYFGMIRNRLTTSKGEPTGAVYAFINSIQKIINDLKPDYIAIAFDAPEKTFRHAIYNDYKGTREATPEELVQQLPAIFDFIKYSNLPLLIKPGFEADDIIGTLAVKGKQAGLQVFLITGDKDMMQLVQDGVIMIKPAVASKEEEVIDENGIKEKLGILPHQVPDYLALIGDSSDNIPGVKGIGQAKAQPLIQEFGSIEGIYQNLDRIGNPRIQEMLKNGREEAFLSKKLATINTDLPLEFSLEELKYREPDWERLRELYLKLEFDSFLKQMQVVVKKEKPAKDYMIIKDSKKLKEIIEEIKKAGTYALEITADRETIFDAQIIGIALCWKAHSGVYIPFFVSEGLFGEEVNVELLSLLKTLFEDNSLTVVGHNLKSVLLLLRKYGCELKGKLFDTMIAAYLLLPDAHSYKLDRIAQQYLDYKIQSLEDLLGEGKNKISISQLPLEKLAPYVTEEADVIFQLKPALENKLAELQVLQVFEQIELPLIPVLAEMESSGVYLNTSFLRQMSNELDKQIDKLVKEIHLLAGVEFNINSPKQLGEILFDRLKLPKIKGYSTDVTVLEKLKGKHPLPEKVLEYRSLVKLQGTYLDALPELVNPKTGRIHSSFNQTGTATGRLSSSDPNFQNIPIRTEIGREIRKAFVPQKEDWLIISADYSQIELRIMAHLSRDPELVRAFEEDVDIHTRTAALVFGVKEKDVLPEMRRVAKVVNFGIMYGAGPFRMSEELGISKAEAAKLIEQYFKTYPRINNYIIRVLEEARKNGYVKTLTGRLRYVPEINSENKNIREAAERIAINMPIQGTAADMIKLAMIKIYQDFIANHLQSKMILQIHDELLFEVSPTELEIVQEIVKKGMEGALPLSVPVKVDIGVGKSWYEAH